jgi:Fic family protein
MKISNLLWQPTDEKNTKDTKEELNRIRERIEQLKEEARVEKDLTKFREARKLQSNLESMSYKTKIGGILRNNDVHDEVRLNDTDIDVPSASEAVAFMNSYLRPEKMEEFNSVFKNAGIIAYISYCVKEMCQMIYYQPFMDGNKRTARSLLNLMFKVRGLPPVYIESRERNDYKKALYKGIKYKDYKDIIGFYLFKICDSIYTLDIVPYKEERLSAFHEEEDNPLSGGSLK